jgi:hypothetical protein
MNLRKLLAATILVLSPLVIAAVSLMMPNLELVLVLMLIPDPETRRLVGSIIVLASLLSNTSLILILLSPLEWLSILLQAL